MEKQTIIWLASFPRSGNTLLRTILFHCFGLRSASIYPDDLDNNVALEGYVGHIEHGPDGKIHFPAGSPALIKTHQAPIDNRPALYVVRHGIQACVSMYHFYKPQASMESIISGRNRFGSWAAHLEAWRPWERPHTLLLKYEDLVNNLKSPLEAISCFLQQEIRAASIPDRDTIAGIDGRHVRSQGAVRQLPAAYLSLFDQINGRLMRKLGYY